MTARRVAGGFLALLGAVGVTASAYLNWFDDRTPETVPIDRLFQSGVTEEASSYWTSVALPLAIVTLLAVIGLVLRSRLILVVGWLIGVATLVLFVVQQANDDADFSVGDLQAGAWVALAGLIVMLLGLASMGGRPKPEPEAAEPSETVSARERGAAGGEYAAGGYGAGAAAAAPSSSAAPSVPPGTPPAPVPLATDAPAHEPPAAETDQVGRPAEGIETPPGPTPEPGPPPAPGPEPAPPPGPEPMPALGPEPAPAPGPAPAPVPGPEPEPGPQPEPEPGTPAPDEPATPPPFATEPEPEDGPPRPA